MGASLPRSPWGRRIREVISQGEPVAYKKLISETAVLVPPGRAYRKRLRRREWLRDARGFNERDNFRKSSEAERKRDAIRTGAELIVKEAFWDYEKAGRLERYEEDGVTMVRVGPTPWPA